MIPVTVHAFISTPREDLFDFIADFGARPAWCDHFMDDYRLAHPRAAGEGAGARYLLDAPGYKHYVEATLTRSERPVGITEQLHGGRNGRSRGELRWELSREGRGLTRVQVTLEWQPGTPRERFKEKFGSRRWTRRQLKSALERLRVIFEEQPDAPRARASIAGFEPLRSSRFGASPHVARG
jgi:Polyketide cyclase / dehydrase and lipid transport